MTDGASGHDEGGGRAKRDVVRRAGIVGLGTLASRLLGLFRDQAIGALFSIRETDAFFLVWAIPNALRSLLAEGAVSSSVVPLLSATLEKDGDAAGRLFMRKVRGLSLFVLGIVTVLGVLFAEPVTLFFASGYRNDPEQLARAVSITRVVFPYIAFMGTAALGAAALNAKKKFGVAAFAPALLNVAFLLAILLLPGPLAAHGIDRTLALAIGAVVGGVLQVVAQVPALREIGYLERPLLRLRDPETIAVLKRITPILLGTGIYYVDLIVSRRILSELGTGAQSYFNWAFRVCDLPQGIFVMAMSTAALPTLSALAQRGDRRGLADTFSHGFRLTMLVSIPASVALAMMAEPLVVALLQRGEFSAAVAHESARALLWQGAGIWTVAAVRQLVPLLYALGDTRTPVIISALDLTVMIVLAYALRGPMGHTGVSVAVVGSSFAQMLMLLGAVKWRLGTLLAKENGIALLRVTGASLIAGFGGRAAAQLATVSGASALLRIVPGVTGGIVFVILFVVAACGFGVRELDTLLGMLRRRLRR